MPLSAYREVACAAGDPKAAAETNPVARGEFANILKNIEEAERLGVPLCQDTGVPVVYLTIPPDVSLTEDLYDAVARGCPPCNPGSTVTPECRGPSYATQLPETIPVRECRLSMYSPVKVLP